MESANDPSLTIDLEACTIRTPLGETIPFTIPATRRAALLEGLDEIGATLRSAGDIDAFQDRDRIARPWIHAR